MDNTLTCYHWPQLRKKKKRINASVSDIYIFQTRNILKEKKKKSKREKKQEVKNLRKEEIIYKRWAVHISVRMNRSSQMVLVIQHNSLLSRCL